MSWCGQLAPHQHQLRRYACRRRSAPVRHRRQCTVKGLRAHPFVPGLVFPRESARAPPLAGDSCACTCLSFPYHSLSFLIIPLSFPIIPYHSLSRIITPYHSCSFIITSLSFLLIPIITHYHSVSLLLIHHHVIIIRMLIHHHALSLRITPAHSSLTHYHSVSLPSLPRESDPATQNLGWHSSSWASSSWCSCATSSVSLPGKKRMLAPTTFVASASTHFPPNSSYLEDGD